MSRIKLRNTSRLRLTDMLRKRKLSLRQFVDELGISTYESLTNRCNRMGVATPSLDEFNALGLAMVTSPAEGVVVLEPPPVILEHTGKPVEESPYVPVLRGGFVELSQKRDVSQAAHKKSKKKKDGIQQRNSGEYASELPDTQDALLEQENSSVE